MRSQIKSIKPKKTSKPKKISKAEKERLEYILTNEHDEFWSLVFDGYCDECSDSEREFLLEDMGEDSAKSLPMMKKIDHIYAKAYVKKHKRR